MKITVLIENTTMNNRLISEHGLSFLIEFEGNQYLLDSGSSSAFINNAKILGVDLKMVDYAILSHGHYDHSGGFEAFLKKYPNQKIYASEYIKERYFSKARGHLHEISIQDSLRDYFNQFVFIHENTSILSNVHLIFASNDKKNKYGSKAHLYNEKMEYDTFMHELTLVFELEDGLVLMNSCSHGGPIEIIKRVKQLFNDKKVIAYIGGLHMKGSFNGGEVCTYSENELDELCAIFKEVDVYTGHCTGAVSYDILKNKLGNKLHLIGAGSIIDINEKKH